MILLKSKFLVFLSLTLVYFSAIGHSHEIKVTNRCSQTIWVGTFGDNNQIPLGGNFRLGPQEQRTFGVINGWTSGRVWGKTGCDSSGRRCATGESPQGGRTTFQPVTLAEFGLDKYMGLDFYDISLVDGYNIPMAIQPIGNTVNLDQKCKRVNCQFNFNVCPANFKQNGAKGVEACNSACSATREERYCCPSPKYNENNCQPSDYSRIFKNQCPDAYSYAFDDRTSLWACKGKWSGSSSYEVIFCP